MSTPVLQDANDPLAERSTRAEDKTPRAATRFPSQVRGAASAGQDAPRGQREEEAEEFKKRERLLFLLEVASDPRLSGLGEGGEERPAATPALPNVEVASPSVASAVRGDSSSTNNDCKKSTVSRKEEEEDLRLDDEEEQRKKRRRIEYAMSVLNAGREENKKMLENAIEEAKRKRAQASLASLTGGNKVSTDSCKQDATSNHHSQRNEKATTEEKKNDGGDDAGRKKDRPKKKRRHVRKRTFAEKLMDVLSNPECVDAISWLPAGDSFVIASPKAFTSDVLPKYFKTAKFESFTRKLNRWGYKRVLNSRSGATGALTYRHEHFRRDAPELCKKMTGGKRDHSLIDAEEEEECDDDKRKTAAAILEQVLSKDNDAHQPVMHPAAAVGTAIILENAPAAVVLPSSLVAAAAPPVTKHTHRPTIKPASMAGATLLPANARAANEGPAATALSVPSSLLAPPHPATKQPALRDIVLAKDRISRLATSGLPTSSLSAIVGDRNNKAVKLGGGSVLSAARPLSSYCTYGSERSRASASLRAAAFGAGGGGGFLLPNGGRLGTGAANVRAPPPIAKAAVERLRHLNALKMAQRVPSSHCGPAMERGSIPLASLLARGSRLQPPSSLLDESGPLPSRPAGEGAGFAPATLIPLTATKMSGASSHGGETASALRRALALSGIAPRPSPDGAASVLRADEERRSYLRRLRKDLELQQQLQQQRRQACAGI